ncbi:MAG TPA: hypothetical protein VFR09_03710 [Alphaproteobacteria bacterium]|nr:hypothetical protein [Alphaproteobacteria bacterium]
MTKPEAKKPSHQELVAMLQTKGWDFITGTSTVPIKNRTLDEQVREAHKRRTGGEEVGRISKLEDAIELDLFQLEKLWEHLGLPM